MNRMTAALAGALALGLLGSYAICQQPAPARQPASRKGILSLLRPGQAVEKGEYKGNTYLRIFEDDDLKSQMKDKVKEVGEDYIVLTRDEDLDDKWGQRELYLPLHAIESIVIVKKKNAE